MSKGKLIIIEAGDGSGKATQTRALYEHLLADGHRVHRIEFPDYEADSSMLVRMYLRGDFGGHAEDVNAFAASTFFAAKNSSCALRAASLNEALETGTPTDWNRSRTAELSSAASVTKLSISSSV